MHHSHLLLSITPCFKLFFSPVLSFSVTVQQILIILLTISALKNAGKKCWVNCGEKEGPCSWCGTEGLCCRKGWTGNGCSGIMDIDVGHVCVREEVVGKFIYKAPEAHCLRSVYTQASKFKKNIFLVFLHDLYVDHQFPKLQQYLFISRLCCHYQLVSKINENIISKKIKMGTSNLLHFFRKLTITARAVLLKNG